MASEFHPNYNFDRNEFISDNEVVGINRLAEYDINRVKPLKTGNSDKLEPSNQFILSESIHLNTFASNDIIHVNSKIEPRNEGLYKIQNLGNYKILDANQGKLGFKSQVDGLNSTFAMISFIIMLLLLI